MLDTFSPGAGRRAPRAHTLSDAAYLGLNGRWQFRYDDGEWTTIEVPGHWQLQGHGRPAYTNVRYPFPLDPPHVPDENPTGAYRRTFDLPADWPGGEAVLRFLGVDSVYTAWLNGSALGWSTGSRLTTEF